MLGFVGILVLGFAPGVFWLWFFVRRDIYNPEPRRLLALTFFLGMLSTLPAALLEFLFLDKSVVSSERSIAAIAVAMLLVVGPVEELSKFAAVRIAPYRSLYFDEPMDGLVYSAAASLGFASAENVGYILQYGLPVMLVRAPLSTLAHAVFGGFWGYALGLQVTHKQSAITFVIAGLSIAAAVHGLFNVLVISNPLVAVMLIAAGTAWIVSRFDWAQRVSPFRYKRNYPYIQCKACLRHIRINSRYCRFCSAPTGSGHQALFCGYCRHRNRPDSSYCTRCGDRLLS